VLPTHTVNIQVCCRSFWLCQDQPLKLCSYVLQHTGRFFLQKNFKLTHELCLICPPIFILHNSLSTFYPLYCTIEGLSITSLILPVRYLMNNGHWFSEVCTDKQTKCVDHNSSWEASISLASQETPHISWIPNVHYCIQKNLPLVPFLIQMNQIFIL
jgi:hypothetical protein